MSSSVKISVENQSLLVKQAQQGNADAFGDLYEAYADEMYRYALWYLGSRELAQDAVSDAVCNAFVSITSLRNAASFKAWLFRILANCCKACLTQKIRARTQVDLESALGLSAAGDDIAAAELWELVRGLDGTDREILLLSVVGGYKSSEIAELLQMPSGTIRSRLSRALSRLRSAITQPLTV